MLIQSTTESPSQVIPAWIKRRNVLTYEIIKKLWLFNFSVLTSTNLITILSLYFWTLLIIAVCAKFHGQIWIYLLQFHLFYFVCNMWRKFNSRLASALNKHYRSDFVCWNYFSFKSDTQILDNQNRQMNVQVIGCWSWIQYSDREQKQLGCLGPQD